MFYLSYEKEKRLEIALCSMTRILEGGMFTAHADAVLCAQLAAFVPDWNSLCLRAEPLSSGG